MVSKNVKAVIWSAIERFSSQLMSMAISLIIARLLVPSDYGIVAMISIFMAVAQSFIDSGFSNALIQKNDRTEVDFSTVFYFNIVVSLLLYFVLYLCSEPIAQFYNEPGLVLVTKISGINLIIQSLFLIQKTKLILELKFKLLTKITLAAVLISGILGIVLAGLGFGAFALIFQYIVFNAITAILLWAATRWKPLFKFSFQSFKQLFSFGSKLLLGGLLHTVYTNLYTLIIGKWYSISNVGFFAKANSLSKLPTAQFSAIVDRVSYPIFCSAQNDNEYLKQLFLKYLRHTIFITFPIATIFAVLAKPFILLILTSKWIGMLSLLQILCFAYMLDPVQGFNWQLLNVKGRSDLSLKSEIIKKVVAIFILFATIPFGVTYICWGLLVYSILDVLIIIAFVKCIFPLGYIEEMKNILPFAFAAIISGGIVFFLTLIIQSLLAQIIVGLITGFSIYTLICIALKCSEVKIIIKSKKLWI